MNKYFIWILIAGILALGGFAYYKHKEYNKTILELRQTLKAEQDSTYGIISELKSTNKELSNRIRAISELVVIPNPSTSSGRVDTVFIVDHSTNATFSGENYLFRYSGEVKVNHDNSGSHILNFSPNPILLTQTLMQDPDGNWYSLVHSRDPQIGIKSKFLIDRSLLFQTNQEIIKPKNFSIMPFVYLRKEWDSDKVSFDAGLRATFYSTYLNLSAREIGIGTYLKFLKF